MIRRNPTRSELKLEDIKEFEQVKRKHDDKKRGQLMFDMSPSDTFLAGGSIDGGTIAGTSKTRTEMINERIGYDPTPKV